MDQEIDAELSAETMVEIDGIILLDGDEAGTIDGFYLVADEPASSESFFEFWDMEQWTCEVHGELIEPGGGKFRQPMARLLERARGILCIRHLALHPRFRGHGRGREVMLRMVHDWADEEAGVVIINSQPLQHRNGAYDNYDDEVRDLPWNEPAEDGARVRDLIRGWGFHHIGGTRWMAAAPEALGGGRAADWPPVRIR